MKEVVCITCPNSCHMMVELQDGKWITKGNRCPRGQKFAEEEMTCPKRTFSTTVRTAWSEVPVIPVRVSEEVPKEKIFEIMEQINHFTVKECIGRNDVLIPHVLGLDADVIVTSDRLKEYLTEGKNE
mgnify:FL=1